MMGFSFSRSATALLALACLALPLATGCNRTPQVSDSPESLAAADGLWTAVTARQLPLIDASEAKIKQLHDAAKMSDDAFAVLEDVIAAARGGDWSDARDNLKAFAKGQRPATRP
jgi:hypothetical protein